MTVDILAEIDGVLSASGDLTEEICRSYFDEAMAGVRDAIDGSDRAIPFCDALDCPGIHGDGYSCTDTLARWVPAGMPDPLEFSPARPPRMPHWGLTLEDIRGAVLTSQAGLRIPSTQWVYEGDSISWASEVQDWVNYFQRPIWNPRDYAPRAARHSYRASFERVALDEVQEAETAREGFRHALLQDADLDVEVPEMQVRPQGQVERFHAAINPGPLVMPAVEHDFSSAVERIDWSRFVGPDWQR